MRDFFTITIVSLALFGSAPQQEGEHFGLQLIAATGDARRTLVRFLDLYAGIKAGAEASAERPGAALSLDASV